MKSLLYPVQLLIIEELQKAEKAQEEADNSNKREFLNNISCNCKFYCSYQLPCHHIWTNNFAFGCLCNEDFKQYKLIWEDCGYETYQGVNKKYIAKDIDDNPFAPVHCWLKMREALESIKDWYYQMEETSLKYQEDDPQMVNKIMNWWLTKLNQAAGEVWQ